MTDKITLEEQIEYMRREIGVQRSLGAYASSEYICKAILSTLERVRDEQQAKVEK